MTTFQIRPGFLLIDTCRCAGGVHRKLKDTNTETVNQGKGIARMARPEGIFDPEYSLNSLLHLLFVGPPSLGSEMRKFETTRLIAEKGSVTARRARVRRNRSSIHEVGGSPDAVCSKRNLSAQAMMGRNRN